MYERPLYIDSPSGMVQFHDSGVYVRILFFISFTITVYSLERDLALLPRSENYKNSVSHNCEKYRVQKYIQMS